jgi:hypothetical protein
MMRLNRIFFLNSKMGLEGPGESFLFIADTITGIPLARGESIVKPKIIVKRTLQKLWKRDQVPPGAHLAVDEEPAQSGRRTTTGDAPLGEVQQKEAATARSSGVGVLHPFGPAGGNGSQAAGEELLQTPVDTQPPSRFQSGSAIELEGIRAEIVDRPKDWPEMLKKQLQLHLPPRRHSRPERRSKHHCAAARTPHGHHDRRRTEKHLRTGHHRQPPRRLLRAPSHCQHVNQVREGAR